MEIEEELFNKVTINYNKLLEYGFKLKDNYYIYKTKFLSDMMEAIIKIDKSGIVKGSIIDQETGEEYNNFRLKDITGEFVSSVKEAYIEILNSIIDSCGSKEFFLSNQSNRITKLIYDKYLVKPEFLWDEYPNFGIFRNERSHKWFCLMMDIDSSKLGLKDNKMVTVINLKLDDEVNEYFKIKGIYPAYHMNKKKWLTIILDDTLSDEYILSLINKSYSLINISNTWLVPANPKYYDIVNAFNNTDTIIWKQSNNILKDDIIYMYVASPYSCILYKCLVIENNIPYEYKDNNVTMSKVMKIKLLKRYNKDAFTLDILKKYGLNSIRGPRSIPKELIKLLDK